MFISSLPLPECTFAVVQINGSQLVISGPLVVPHVLGGPVANYKCVLKIRLNVV